VADDIGFQHLPPASAKSDDATGFEAMTPTKVTPRDRLAYTEARLDNPKDNAIRKEIEERYGGRDTFRGLYDPFGQFMDEKVLPPALAAAVAIGVPELALAARAGLVPASMLGRNLAAGGQPQVVGHGIGEVAKAVGGVGAKVGSGAKAVATNPAVKEILKALGYGSAFEVARKVGKAAE
jgi:hypothetical protein